jgi:CO/xanthine dehydrogenase FAD-binding subunit
MKPFANANPRDLRQAVTLARDAQQNGRRAMFAGGGSDALGMMKEGLAAPDVLVRLKAISGLD